MTGRDLGQEGTPQRSAWVYDELLRIEGHYTQQVQNQQSRITTSLTVTGFMFAFLASAAFLQTKASHSTYVLLLWALIVFSIGLLAGVVALFSLISVSTSTPRSRRPWSRKAAPDPTPDTEPDRNPSKSPQAFLDTDWLKDKGLTLPNSTLYETLIGSIQTKRHESAIRFRRALLRVQLGAIGIAVVLLVIVFVRTL